jgi:phosphoserine phosphatase
MAARAASPFVREGRVLPAVCLALIGIGLLAACEPSTIGSTADYAESVAEAKAARDEADARAEAERASTPLASWRDTPARGRIIAFVESVTDPDGDSFVPAEERIAVFDNDGTLWSEKPLYAQLLYAMDYVEQHVTEHPEWRGQQPFQAVLEGDHEALAAAGEQGIVELVMASHAGMTAAEFDASIREYLATAKNPEKGRLFTRLVYQPMLELLDYLRAHGFETWIVTGGGIDFVRTFSEDVYGIPPEQVVGSGIEMTFELRDGTPVLVRQPKLAFIDDKAGKPVGIHRHIGRRPIAAFGNSDGDLQMLEWTAAGDGARMMALVHHTDAEREWAYDDPSTVGQLDVALKAARDHGWLVIDMKEDWKVVYPFEP